MGYVVKNNMNQGLDLLADLFMHIFTVLYGVFVHNIKLFYIVIFFFMDLVSIK